MAPKTLVALLVVALVAVALAADYQVAYKNTGHLFKFKSEESRKESIDSGRYKQENSVPAGVKSFDGTLYVSIPRWAPGVPITLAELNTTDNTLRPFPNQDFQNAADHFRYVQSMEIDSKGRMWVLDTGRQNILKGDAIAGTPAIFVVDLTATNKKGAKRPKLIARHNLPEDVASSTTSFINDIVVDDQLDVAYISDASGDGAIIVFDLKANKSHRVTHPTMKYDDSVNYQLDGVGMNAFKIPIDGIALTPDKSTVFFNALLGNNLFSVPAAQLRAFTTGASLDVTDHGKKPASDGIAFGSNGKLYFGSLPDNSVLEWTPGTPLSSARTIAQSSEDLSWPDTLGFDNKGNLLVLSNRLHKWVSGSLDINDSNFRVVSIPIGANVRSYVFGPDASETAKVEEAAAVTVPTTTVSTAPDATTATTSSDTTTSTTSAESAGSTPTTTTTTTTTSTTADSTTPKTSPAKRLWQWLQGKADRLATWLEEKLPGNVTLPRLSWCSIKCTLNSTLTKAKEVAVTARDRLHTCAANTTACREDVSEVYKKDALTSGAVLCGLFALVCWVGSLATGDLSWVDRLWSILPVVYTLHFWSYEPTDPRLSVMAVLALAWGVRLTYNFYRKGGYTSHGEDYRWEVLRKEISNPWLFHLFNLVFVAIIQNILLFAIALPAYAALQSSVPLNGGDSIASLTFFLALALETFADQQQWIFQESKYNRLPRQFHLAHDYENGFLTSGLFSYSRHPNFFAEQTLWIAFALFSLPATGSFGLFWWAGALSLVALFQGSTTFTEKITVSKYPAYTEYQQTTSRLWPLPPVAHPHSD